MNRRRLPSRNARVVVRRERWRVDRVCREAGIVRLDLSNRRQRRTFLVPFDRPAADDGRPGMRRIRRRRAWALVAHHLGRSYGYRSIGSVASAAIDILPHQLEPALALASGARRVLVGDEVGLGKTIQAGIAIAERLRRRPDARILVVVPASLQAQWEDELCRRFKLVAVRGDRRGLDEQTRRIAFGENPWATAGLWIASLDFLKQQHVARGLPLVLWDLVVVDEAHDVCGDSARHRACDELARRARGLVLLSATPHTGDPVRFNRLCALGELGAGDSLVFFRRTRADLGARMPRRVRWHRVRLAPAEHAVLDALVEFESRVLRSLDSARHDGAVLLLSVFRKRALSTMGALARSLARRMDWLTRRGQADAPDWFQRSLEFEPVPADAMSEDDLRGLTADLGLSAAHERSWLGRLASLTLAAVRDERRVSRVVDLIERSREPVVVFTEYRDSLDVLTARLGPWRPVATLHGGQHESERERELARFLSADVSVLLTTDVASQGLNLQSRARWVMSLELPWNPARLEQRAGRVDRIGQQKPVHVTWLVGDHSSEDRLVDGLARRVRAARQAVGADVLPLSLPSEASIRDDVILGSRGPDASPVAMPSCRRWTRPSRVVARAAALGRLASRHWRGPSPGWTGVVNSRRSGRHATALLVFASPIYDATGDAIEDHVVALTWTGAPGHDGRVPPAVIEAARELVAMRMTRRAVRLAARLETAVASLAARERALVDRLVHDVSPGEIQSGLFDRRSESRARDLGIQIEEIRATAASRLLAIHRQSSLDAGRPRLVLVVFEP